MDATGALDDGTEGKEKLCDTSARHRFRRGVEDVFERAW